MPLKVSRFMEAVYHYPGYFNRPAKCLLRVYRLGPDRPAVVIASELPDNPGTSITNRAEVIAAAVCRDQGLDPDTTLFVEHYPAALRATLPERFSFVEFDRPALGVFARPRWSHTTRAVVEHLISEALP